MTISWTAPGSGSAVSGYRIMRGTDPGNLSAVAADTGNTNVEYTDSTVAEETAYHYAVLALSQDGDGAQSATVPPGQRLRTRGPRTQIKATPETAWEPGTPRPSR